MSIIGIIPARYASTRFPGKPLADIAGKSMIRRVYEQASQASLLDKVVVATDDMRIKNHVREFGGEVVMTSDKHPSGTDRCYEAAIKAEGSFDIAINIQGDEPFIHPEQIDQLANCFADESVQIATLIKKIDSTQELIDINKPKVIFDSEMNAMYFGRMPVPYLKGVEVSDWLEHRDYFQHIGMYAYRVPVLREITQIEPSELEKAESLEQLRWLENGYPIKVQVTPYASRPVDTPEDLEAILEDLESQE